MLNFIVSDSVVAMFAFGLLTVVGIVSASTYSVHFCRIALV